MKRSIYLMAVAIVACCMFTGCKKNLDAKLTPKSTVVKGELSEYFKVVDKEYIVKYDESGWNKYTISIELERTDVPFAFDTEGVDPVGYSGAGVTGNYGVGLIVYDSDGSVVVKWGASASGFSGCYSSDDLKALKSLKAGETAIVRWTTDAFKDIKVKEFTFDIDSYLEIRSKSSSSSKTTTSSNSTSADSTSSNKWDKVLDEYEQYVDKYIAVLKKVNNGDMSAYSDMVSLMEKLDKLSDKLEDADDEMTPTQMARYTKITTKMASAL